MAPGVGCWWRNLALLDRVYTIRTAMDYRVLTISREFASGGSNIAKMIADRLGWKCVDGSFIDEIAKAAHVHPEVARRKDECTDSWLDGLARDALRATALAGTIAVGEADFFDAETMTAFTRKVIETSHKEGNAVIVGRGGACILADRRDVFHVFVYGSEKCRCRRLKTRMPEVKDPEALIRTSDVGRARYVRHFFNRDWKDPSLYELMVRSDAGDEYASKVILAAMGIG
jgi:cytidylate kinase